MTLRSWAGLLGAGGVLLLLASFVTRANQWLSGVFVEFGATLFLAVPLLLVTSAITTSLRLDREATERALRELQSELSELEKTLIRNPKDVDDLISHEIQSKRKRESQMFSALRTNPSREDFRFALAEAKRLDIVGARGPRVELTGADMLIRWRLGDDGDLSIILEHFHGERWKSWEWPEGTSFPEILSVIAEDLISSGNPPDPGGLNSSQALVDLENLLQIGLSARYDQVDNTLRSLLHIEGNAVAVTDRGIVQLDNPRYLVPIARLGDMNWYDHMSEKTWLDKDNFFQCIDIARSLLQLGEIPTDPNGQGETPIK